MIFAQDGETGSVFANTRGARPGRVARRRRVTLQARRQPHPLVDAAAVYLKGIDQLEVCGSAPHWFGE